MFIVTYSGCLSDYLVITSIFIEANLKSAEHWAIYSKENLKPIARKILVGLESVSY